MYSKRTYEKFLTHQNIRPEAEMLVIFANNNYTIIEVQVEMKERIFGESYLNTSSAIKFMVVRTIGMILLKNIKFKGE